MDISAKDVIVLRKKTGAGMMDCKKALTDSKGDMEKAEQKLREKGIAAAQKRAGRETKNGYIAVYVHPGARLATMVELNCETDFVARNEQFQKFAKNIAMHIAATSPLSISENDIDPSVIEKESNLHQGRVAQNDHTGSFERYYRNYRREYCYRQICAF